MKLEDQKAYKTGKGIGYLHILTIVLVLLKSFGVIAIPWLMVFMPSIISLALLVLVLLFLLVVFVGAIVLAAIVD